MRDPLEPDAGTVDGLVRLTHLIYALHSLIERRFKIPPAPPEEASADIVPEARVVNRAEKA